jgi:hypothetical protein
METRRDGENPLTVRKPRPLEIYVWGAKLLRGVALDIEDARRRFGDKATQELSTWLRRKDRARWDDFETRAPVGAVDATLAPQLFGDVRARYLEIRAAALKRGCPVHYFKKGRGGNKDDVYL